MFGAKKPERPKRDRSGRNLAQYGLFDNLGQDMNVNLGSPAEDDEDDDDLEAELAALTGGGAPKPQRPPRKHVPDADLDAMVAASMKDVPSDAELSGDDDDPELLNELSNITGEEPEQPPAPVPAPTSPQNGPSDAVSLLNSRLKMYEEAEKNAKAAGETGRARRFNRGLKTIKDLLRQANAGAAINDEDIPPEVSTGPRKAGQEDPQASPARAAPPPPAAPVEEVEEEVATVSPPSIDVHLLNMLTKRRDQYKVAALKAKKAGDNATALSYIKVSRQFDGVISAAQSGQPVDLSRMPEPPPQPSDAVEENETQSNEAPPEGEAPRSEEESLVTASTVEEALEQRLEVYRKQEEGAKGQGNAGKARRMGRIVKQYEEALRAHRAGRPIAADELPTPPGYAPIPAEGGKPEEPEAKPSSPARATQPSTSQTTRITGNQVPNSRAEKQLVLLLAKQKQFKEAALSAKRKGEMEQAKEFLRTAKGFDPLIEAASCGLPVDLSTLPVSPSAKSHLDNEYDIVMAEECTESDSSDIDVIARLENQLTKQLKMCLSTRDHHKALGDVGGTNRFERLALNVTKDLDLVRLAKKTPGAGVPNFHYEMRDFSIVKSFTELGDNDLELTIVRGISYTCSNPKDIDTYVKFEFPYPQEEPYTQRTSTVKDTNSPEYNATYSIPIQRTARACQRVFKRHSIKFEVYSKGCWCASDIACCFSGFFRGDTLLGTATVKLQPLETQCELHDSFDLLEGRKKIGGKLEVRLRLRHPIVSQQVEQLHEKWLVIDS